jgi:hypothetical protein
MSQDPHENIDVYNAKIGTDTLLLLLSSPFSSAPSTQIGVDQYRPDAAQNQALHRVSNFVDASGPIFSMYLEMATEEDTKMVENWKADADGILIFVRSYLLIWCFMLTRWPQTGLFSAAVASLISISIQDIQQNPQDISNFYLANTYKATINPNLSSSLPTSPPSFSPPNYAVWVNTLWFLSLSISLTCALFATFLQQWARRYLKVTQSRYSLHKRARIRAFFAEGVEKCHLPWVVETLPILLHISLFLFFAGLVVFLSNVNLTIFKAVVSWVAISAALYGCITLMPILRHDSPFYTSLTSLVWSIVMGMALFVSVVSGLFLYCTVFGRYGAEWLIECANSCADSLSHGVQRTAEETALKSPSAIDTRAFMWAFESLDEDDELERFFAGLPGFRTSKVVADPLPSLFSGQMLNLIVASDGLLDRTLSSDLLPDSVRKRRAMILAKALDPKHFPYAFSTIESILCEFQYSGPLATGIAEILRGWRLQNDRDEGTVLQTQAIISEIVARMKPRDDSWFILASSELGVPEDDLRGYAADGSSLSLAILIYLTRQQSSHLGNQPSDMFSSIVLLASRFNVRNTSPELQHKICALWNQIVCKAQKDNDWEMAELLLGNIRRVYAAIHGDSEGSIIYCDGSDVIMVNPNYMVIPGCSRVREHPPLDDSDPSSYSLCDVPDHHPYLTPHIPDRTSSPRIVPYDDDTPVIPPYCSFSSPDITYTPAEGADALPLDNNISIPVNTTTETHRILSTSPDPITTLTMNGDIHTSSRMMSMSNPEPSA